MAELKPPLILRPEQEQAVEQILRDHFHLCRAEGGAGKAQPLDSLVLTKRGFIKMGEVEVGMKVSTPKGGEATVLGVYPQGIRPVYEVTLKGGRKVRADEDHFWTVANENHVYRGQTVLKTTKELLEGIQSGKRYQRYYIEHVSPDCVDGDWQSSIPPYALGLLLGNGALSQQAVGYSTSDQETVDYLRSVVPDGHEVKYRSAYDYAITTGTESGAPRRNLWLNELRRLGLMGHKAATKFIPQALLESSLENRLALLQGLLDTDGSACYAKPSGTRKGGAASVEYSSASYQLAQDVCWLVHSLGGTTYWSVKVVNGVDYYRIRVALPNGITPFRVRRKADKMTGRTTYPVRHTPVVAVEFVGYEPTQCILLDSEEHEYVTDGFVRTHNTVTAVEAVLRSGAALTLVVCPLNTFSSWSRTFIRQSRGAVVPRVTDNRAAGKRALEDCMSGVPGVYLISWQKFQRYDWFKSKVDFVVWDEVHRAQSRKSVNHRACTTMRRVSYRLALSATPAGNNISGLWAVARSLWWRDYSTSFWTWVSQYCLTEADPYAGHTEGTKKVEGVKVVGEREPGAIWRSLPSASYFKSPYQEEPILHTIEVELVPAQRRLYDRFEAEALVWLQEHPLAATLPIVKRVRLRDIALAVPSIRRVWRVLKDEELVTFDGPMRDRDDGRVEGEVDEVFYEDDAKSTKAEAVMEVLSDLYAGGSFPVLIYTHSRRYATMLTKQLQAKGFEARQWIGGMSKVEREWKMENFGDTFDVMVCTIGSIGEGTDGLQEVCHTEFWVSLEDNRILNQQAIWRLSRLGQKETVQRYIFMAKDTIELKQIDKQETDQAILDASFAEDHVSDAA